MNLILWWSYVTTMQILQIGCHIVIWVWQSNLGHLAIKNHKAEELNGGEGVSFPEK